jgi:hypothetical protein
MCTAARKPLREQGAFLMGSSRQYAAESHRSRRWVPPEIIGFDSEPPVQLALEGFGPPDQLALDELDDTASQRENSQVHLGSDASNRGRSILVSFHDGELALLDSRAGEVGLSLSAYIRACALDDPRPPTHTPASLGEDLKVYRSDRLHRFDGKPNRTTQPFDRWLARYYPEDSTAAPTIARPNPKSPPKLVHGTQHGEAPEAVSMAMMLGQVEAGPAILTQPELARPEIAMNIGDIAGRARVIAKLADIVAGLISSRKRLVRDEVLWREDACAGEEANHELLRS